MSDLISKQEVIKAIDKFIPVDPLMSDYTQGISVGLAIATRCIEEFSQENHDSSQGLVKDLISRQAVKHLDLFTKTYCRDKSVKDDLVFRCNQCDFKLPDGTCLVKTMARKLCPDYREFGSMGDL